jgi:hypothetical protein
MSVIKRRTRGKQFVRHTTRLERENHETLHAYAQFLAESAEYVLNQLVETKLAKDKEFVAWRVEHPESFVPSPGSPAKKGTHTARDIGRSPVAQAQPEVASAAVAGSARR